MSIYTARYFPAAAFMAILWATVPASQAAAGPVEKQSVTVRYSDLDLNSAAGAATLDRRIARAIDKVCGAADSRLLTDIARRDACRATALAEASARRDAVIALAHAAPRYAMNATGTAPKAD